MAKILIIDDDETMHVICRAYLGKAGHTVETALDGEDGLAKAGAFQPDLLLLDINMPRMSGFEVAKKLKDNPATKDIPVFMMTSLRQETNIQRGYSLGIDEYITKPVNVEHLKLRIDKFLEKKK
jgi:DNA-binding response OmpR family regulator